MNQNSYCSAFYTGIPTAVSICKLPSGQLGVIYPHEIQYQLKGHWKDATEDPCCTSADSYLRYSEHGDIWQSQDHKSDKVYWESDEVKYSGTSLACYDLINSLPFITEGPLLLLSADIKSMNKSRLSLKPLTLTTIKSFFKQKTSGWHTRQTFRTGS